MVTGTIGDGERTLSKSIDAAKKNFCGWTCFGKIVVVGITVNLC